MIDWKKKLTTKSVSNIYPDVGLKEYRLIEYNFASVMIEDIYIYICDGGRKRKLR